MKTVIIGDIHGRSTWKSIINKEKPNRVIFMGDYFDSFDITGVEQIHNFKEIINYKETNPDIEVIFLIGNHDHHYYPGIGDTGTSGFQTRIAFSITQVIDENKHHLQIAYGFDNYLFTHAGVSPTFMDECFGIDGWSKENIVNDLNELFKYKPKSFIFNGYDSSGDDINQTPIWIRPNSLILSNKRHKKGLKKEYIQIVGHTQMKKVDLKNSDKYTGGRYYFIDTLGTSGEYLIIQENQLTVNSVK
jgi:predicted MPP superfamily phosphohydrolase